MQISGNKVFNGIVLITAILGGEMQGFNFDRILNYVASCPLTLNVDEVFNDIVLIITILEDEMLGFSVDKISNYVD